MKNEQNVGGKFMPKGGGGGENAGRNGGASTSHHEEYVKGVVEFMERMLDRFSDEKRQTHMSNALAALKGVRGEPPEEAVAFVQEEAAYLMEDLRAAADALEKRLGELKQTWPDATREEAAQGSQMWSDWRRSKPLPGQDHATGNVNVNDALKYTGPPVDLDDAEHAQDASAYLAEMRSAAVGAIYQYRDELVDFADATGLPMPEVDALNEAVSLIERAGSALHQRVAPDLPS